MSKIIKFSLNLPAYMNDVAEIIRAFYPYISSSEEEKTNFLNLDIGYLNSLFRVSITSNFVNLTVEEKIQSDDNLVYKRLTKRLTKNILYKALSNICWINLPYGSLTGVRPTKLYYELMEECVNPKKTLIDYYFVNPQKACLIEAVVNNQKDIYSIDSKNVDIYVNIPFCPSRCKYCSFISTEIGRIKKRIPDYLNCLKKELSQISQKIENESLNVRSIYVGGGTPSVLDAEELNYALSGLSKYNSEFTVECGRADTITWEKLKALSLLNVTRISINPQTFNDTTLKELGRGHTGEDVIKAYRTAKEFDFDINMDLILGLNGETLQDTKESLKKTIALNPENITIHTLSIKRGAEIKNLGQTKSVSGIVSEMSNYSFETLNENGYLPYYMYRQKNMSDNLENVGYSKKGKECIYNIDYMEETTTILSAGAGAVSKILYPNESRHERHANPKGLNEYLEKFFN